MARSTLAPLVFALSFVLPVGAQQSPQRPPSFRAGVQTVPLYATVIDAEGRLVSDLEKKDFEVYDDGKLQELTIFKSDIQPITVVVMLDTSGSMTMNLELLKDAAEKFVIRLLPADKARIGSFSDKIDISPTFTSNRDNLIRYLHEDIDYGNPTRLWDAVDVSMSALAREQGRRVVLVFTDGDDTYSRKSFGDVLARAQTEEFMVYAIGLRSRVLGQRETRPDRHLKGLAEDTGGGYFELKQTTELNSTFSKVADELHRQYVLGFSPAKLDGKVHRLEVRVKRPGMVARARKTYVADLDR